MSRQTVLTVIDDDDEPSTSQAVSDRTRSRRHASREPSGTSTLKRSASARRKAPQTSAATSGAEGATAARNVRHRSTPATVVDLTQRSPTADEEDVVLVAVSQPPQPGSRILAGCRRLSAAIPGLGSGPLLGKQARTKASTSPSPIAAPPPHRQAGVHCGICMDPLKDPACGACGHVYCEACLKDAVKVQKKCPTCRKAMQPRQIRRVFF